MFKSAAARCRFQDRQDLEDINLFHYSYLRFVRWVCSSRLVRVLFARCLEGESSPGGGTTQESVVLAHQSPWTTPRGRGGYAEQPGGVAQRTTR